MHDGRFVTLEEVIDHYDQADSKPAMGHREGQYSQPLNLSRTRKAALIKFFRITDIRSSRSKQLVTD